MRLLLDRLEKIYPKSLISEFYRMFGAKNTEKLIDVFSGTTIVIPSRKDLENAQRDIIIYETLSLSVTSTESKLLGQKMSDQFQISRRKVRQIYKRMRRQLKENQRFREADTATGKLENKKMKTRRRSKVRL